MKPYSKPASFRLCCDAILFLRRLVQTLLSPREETLDTLTAYVAYVAQTLTLLDIACLNALTKRFLTKPIISQPINAWLFQPRYELETYTSNVDSATLLDQHQPNIHGFIDNYATLCDALLRDATYC